MSKESARDSNHASVQWTLADPSALARVSLCASGLSRAEPKAKPMSVPRSGTRESLLLRHL